MPPLQLHIPIALTLLCLMTGAVAGLATGDAARRLGFRIDSALRHRGPRAAAALFIGAALGAGIAPVLRYQPWTPLGVVVWGSQLALPLLSGLAMAGAAALGRMEWPYRRDRPSGRGIGQAALAAALFSGLAIVSAWPARAFGPPQVAHGVVQQTTPVSCVPSALATLLRLTGLDPGATEAAVARAAGTTSHGTGTPGERAVLRARGVVTEFRRGLGASDLSGMTHPAILHVRVAVGTSGINHAVALLWVDAARHRVLIGDPSGGPEWVAMERFTRDYWPGEAVILSTLPFPPTDLSLPDGAIQRARPARI